MNMGHTGVVVMDNLETGSLANLEPWLGDNKLTFIHGNIRNYQDCLKACENIDVVLHQAALGSVPRSIEKPLETHATNVDGFINMLEAARSKNVKRFVYASSSSVYGDDLSLPKKEEVVGNPLSPYAVSKKTNELYAGVYASLYNMHIVGLRYFNVFGPKQNPAGPYAAVIPIFINRLLNGDTCNIYGDGNNRRDFTYVSNVVQANLLAAAPHTVRGSGSVMNVAFGSTKTINELYHMIREKLGVNKAPVYATARTGEIKDSFADITRIKIAFGFHPKVSLEEGIEKTIQWYRANQIK